MKLDPETRFPHPVLSPDTGDYKTGEFHVRLSVVEDTRVAAVSLEYEVVLTEPTLKALVDIGNAAVGLYVSCQESYFSELVQLGMVSQVLPFTPGKLIGRVEIRAMIWATQAIERFDLANCNIEFGKGTCSLEAGAVLALGDELLINVGREKLAQMDTVFALVEAPELQPGILSLQLDSERITILAAKDVYEPINRLRGVSNGRSIVLNSVYLPAVIEVLGALREGANGMEGRRWYKVFTAKCEHLGIHAKDGDQWKNAQLLLEAPFGEIAKNQALFGD